MLMFKVERTDRKGLIVEVFIVSSVASTILQSSVNTLYIVLPPSANI